MGAIPRFPRGRVLRTGTGISSRTTTGTSTSGTSLDDKRVAEKGVPQRGSADTSRRNPVVTGVHAKEARWRDEFAALRELCLAAGLNEELKWGQACYDVNGGKVVLIHGFKNYCALLFLKGALLTDRKGLLVQQTRNVQAARQIRFASVADIHQNTAAIKAYLKDAMAVERSGARVVMKSVAQFDVPEEWQVRLDADPRLAEAFHALTPGRQKAYLLHFSGAKQSGTRAARVARNVPRILQGLGLDD
jgi:uncharacterized protein YdeI (YjbR/CyaY-like superfamily)